MRIQNAKRIYKAHKRTLAERRVTSQTRGYGRYMFVHYDVNFAYAIIERFRTLEQLIGGWSLAFSFPCHIEINYAYLREAGLLAEHEKDNPITPTSNRIWVCHRRFGETLFAIDPIEEEQQLLAA